MMYRFAYLLLIIFAPSLQAQVDTEAIVEELYEIGVVQFGQFTLKSGALSPVYVDMRKTYSYPELLNKLSMALEEKLNDCSYNLICGIPQGAIPYATAISISTGTPMLLARSTEKQHGNKRMIEGAYKSGDRVALVEDVTTTGGSILQIVNLLKAEGLDVKDACVIIDREQGGAELLQNAGVELHSLWNLKQVLDVLVSKGRIDDVTYQTVMDWLDTGVMVAKKEEQKTYAERAALCANPLSQKIFQLMEKKSSNLILAADVTTKSELLQLVEAVGSEICVLKTHIDIIEDFDNDLIDQLKELAEKHEFVLFEDRKFADIGNTVQLQYEKGVYHIGEWAELVTVHTVPGPGILKAIGASIAGKKRGVVLLPQMSSTGNLASGEYTNKSLKMVQENPDLVVGIIARQKLIDDPRFIHMVPGIKMGEKKDKYDQSYITPYEAIADFGCDMIVVGRGIYQAKDPRDAASLYRQEGWNAYLSKLSSK